MKIYNNDDIQEMIKETKSDEKLRNAILAQLSGRDKAAVEDVLAEGWYERFDRYDSDVCEQFITAYENANKEV